MIHHISAEHSSAIATSPAACRLPVADAAAGKSVLARTLTLPARLLADARPRPFRGSKRSSLLGTTRTRWGRRAGESLRPISACGLRRPGRRGRHPACRWSERAGVSEDADLRSPPTHAAETRPKPSASTSDHVLPDVRISSAGPIARRGRRHESSPSRRASAQVPSRRASFRRAEPGGVSRHADAH